MFTHRSLGYFYECEVCSHKFSLKGPYENHLRVHTGEKPFKCEKCESAFPSKESLSMRFSVFPLIMTDDSQQTTCVRILGRNILSARCATSNVATLRI